LFLSNFVTILIFAFVSAIAKQICLIYDTSFSTTYD